MDTKAITSWVSQAVQAIGGQRSAALAAGVSVRTIASWSAGTATPALDSALRLADASGVPLPGAPTCGAEVATAALQDTRDALAAALQQVDHQLAQLGGAS